MDCISGQPEAKFTPVRLSAFHPKWHALLVTRQGVDAGEADYWTTITGTACSITAMAGTHDVSDWESWAQDRLGGENSEWLSFCDPSGGRHRFAALNNGRLSAAVFISPRADLPSLDWVQTQFGLDALDDQARAGLLAGRAAGAVFDPGPMVCSCFSVGVNDLRRAITEDQALTVEDIGAVLKAGTNCGSCRSEIQAIINAERPPAVSTSPQQAVA